MRSSLASNRYRPAAKRRNIFRKYRVGSKPRRAAPRRGREPRGHDRLRQAAKGAQEGDVYGDQKHTSVTGQRDRHQNDANFKTATPVQPGSMCQT
jgi:hypothetical protein